MSAFYAEPPSQIFRLGDIVTGFQHPAFQIDKPGSDEIDTHLKIHLTRPLYFAVMTPCCSIENQCISLAPLIELRHKFFEFPRLVEDMTRLNITMKPEESLPPKAWDNLPLEQKGELLAKGDSYIFLQYFVYQPHAFLKPYALKKGSQVWPDIGYRMVDFKQTFRVDCSQIERNRPAPVGTKLLELSIAARSQLRDKLAHFFGRMPDEDRV